MNFKYSEQLLALNNQFSGDRRLNHEAISILMKHGLKTRNAQTFVLAGSEDLRALLPKLELAESGNEAFILLRPYIHSMALYLRNHNGLLYAFLFDSQNWGLRYYPTRNILDALTTQLPFEAIYLSGTEVQPQSVNTGCIYYSLNTLEFCELHGKKLFDQFANAEKTALPQFLKVHQLSANALPQDLLSQLTDKNLVKSQHQLALQGLERLLTEHYVVNDQLTIEKVHAVTDELQGYNWELFEMSLSQCSFYSFSLDSKNAKLTINFKNKDLLTYSNVLLFSDEVYPCNVSIDRSKSLSTAQNNIKVTVNTADNSLTYSAPSLVILEQEFARLVQQRRELFAQHMRQQVALKEIAHAVQETIELSRIMDSNGGFEQRQVQMALAYLFQEEDKIYIPKYTELSGAQAVIPLKELQQKNYQYVAFSFDDKQGGQQSEHQVAVWIDLAAVPYKVTIFDSLGEGCKDNSRLVKLLGQANCEYQLGNSPYVLQKRSWCCGVYVIKHLLAARSNYKPATKQDLDAELLAREYYRAYKLQEQREVKSHQEAEKNDTYKRTLLSVLQSTNTSKVELIHLNNFLQLELWGNLNVGAADRVNESDESHRTRPLRQTLAEYKKSKQQDSLGLQVLQVAMCLQSYDLRQFAYGLNLFLNNFRIASGNFEKVHDKSHLDEFIFVICGEVTRTIEDRCKTIEGKHKLMQEAISKLLDSDNAESNLKALFSLVDCEYFCDYRKEGFNVGFREFNKNQFSYINTQLIAKLISNIDQLECHEINEQKKKEEAQKKLEMRQKRLAAIKRILTDAGIPRQEDIFYSNLNKHFCARSFIEKYVNQDYLSTLDVAKKIAFLTELLSGELESDLGTALELYKGNDLPGYVRTYLRPTTLEKLIDLLRGARGNSFTHFVDEYSYLIRDFNDVHKILKSLVFVDEDSGIIISKEDSIKQRAIAIKFASLLTSFSHLETVLDLFPYESILPYVLANKSLITTAGQLARVMSHLSLQDSYILATETRHLITDVQGLFQILRHMPNRSRSEFVLAHKALITDGENLGNLLEIYPELLNRPELSGLVDQVLKPIGYDLFKLIPQIPKQLSLKFLTRFAPAPKNPNELFKLIAPLNLEEAKSFVKAKIQIKTYRELYVELFGYRLPEERNSLAIISFFAIHLEPTAELVKFFFLMLCSKTHYLHEFLRQHADWVFTMLENKTLSIKDLAGLYDLPSGVKPETIKKRLDSIITSPERYKPESLKSLLASGFEFILLLGCQYDETFDYLFKEVSLLTRLVNKYANFDLRINDLTSKPRWQLEACPPFSIENARESFRSYCLDMSDTEQDFFADIFANLNANTWHSVIFRHQANIKKLARNKILVPEDFSCLDRTISDKPLENLETLLSSPSKINETALQDLLSIGLTFAQLYLCNAPQKVHCLLSHSKTIVKALGAYLDLKNNVLNLFAIQPEILNSILSVINAVLASSKDISVFGSIMSGIFSGNHSNFSEFDKYLVSLLSDQPQATRTSFLKICKQVIKDMPTAHLLSAFPELSTEAEFSPPKAAGSSSLWSSVCNFFQSSSIAPVKTDAQPIEVNNKDSSKQISAVANNLPSERVKEDNEGSHAQATRRNFSNNNMAASSSSSSYQGSFYSVAAGTIFAPKAPEGQVPHLVAPKDIRQSPIPFTPMANPQ